MFDSTLELHLTNFSSSVVVAVVVHAAVQCSSSSGIFHCNKGNTKLHTHYPHITKIFSNMRSQSLQ